MLFILFFIQFNCYFCVLFSALCATEAFYVYQLYGEHARPANTSMVLWNGNHMRTENNRPLRYRVSKEEQDEKREELIRAIRGIHIGLNNYYLHVIYNQRFYYGKIRHMGK
jgi:hypothetical protein